MYFNIGFIALGIIAALTFIAINRKNDSFYKKKMNGVWWLQMMLLIFGMQGIAKALVVAYNYYGLTSDYLYFITLFIVMLILTGLGEKATMHRKKGN